MKRRSFLQSESIIGLTAKSLPINNIQAANVEPIIIATWKNEEACKEGFARINETGKALDGVEAGAWVPEANPEETTVGYGGYPDRDGHVTLDACIMDHKGNAGSVTFLEGIMHPISVARAVMEKTIQI